MLFFLFLAFAFVWRQMAWLLIVNNSPGIILDNTNVSGNKSTKVHYSSGCTLPV